MIVFDKPIYSRKDGTYVITHNGYPYHVIKSDQLFSEVESYLVAHPEALVPEPVPEPPSQEELARSEEQSLLAYLTSTDWYAVRFAECGEAIPNEMKVKRQEARDRISELRL